MRIIRVFARRTSYTPTDEMAFVGDPPLFRPEANEVHISVTFTWDKEEGDRLWEAWDEYYPGQVSIGGPAFFGTETTDYFHPGLYVKPGITFTSRGCNNRCPFCLVPLREGRLKLLCHIPPGNVIQDNNFLQCPPEHRKKVYAMLAKQRKAAVFAGGIDARLVDAEIAAEFASIRIRSLFLACDSDAALAPLERAVKHLQFLSRRQLRCYVLCGYGGEGVESADRRLERCWEIGVLPFAQLYQPPDRWIEYRPRWKALQRKWARPAAMMSSHTKEGVA